MKLIIILLIISQSLQADAINDEIDWHVLKFRYILEQAALHSADTIDVRQSSEDAYRALLQSINQDSKYFDKAVMTKIMSRETNQSVSIGIRYLIVNDTVTVLEDYSGRIVSGSKITEVNNKNVIGETYDKLNLLLNGEPDSYVRIKTYYRGEFEELDFKREEYQIEPVSPNFDINNSGMCYVKIDRFSDEVGDELGFVLEELNSVRQLQYLILDLRNNTGGQLNEVVNCLSHFFPDSTYVTETKSRTEEFSQKYYTKGNGKYQNIPIAVLIDSTTQSGGEMFAAAIQEYDRGITVGSRTYGKGSVQRAFQMKDSTAFRLTVAYYYTPLGRKIEVSNRSAKELVIAGEGVNEEIRKKIQGLPAGDINYVKTAKERVYFETGGISPDFKVYNDTLTALTKLLKARGIFFQYAFDYVSKNEKILEEYNNFKIYASMFKLTETDMREFIQMCLDNNIWNNAMFEQDKSNIYNNIKAGIAYIYRDNEAYEYQLINYDKLVIEAIKRYNDSKLLLN